MKNCLFLSTSRSLFGFSLLLIICQACSIDSEPIRYGQDQCSYCHMTIVDKIHAAEIVNENGKVFKYDAVECMINDLAAFQGGSPALNLVNHYESPEMLHPAEESTFLISENFPSPMGANLTAFSIKDSALSIQAKMGGSLYSWKELNNHLNSQDEGGH